MVRSIVGDWKLPLYFDFDTAIRRDLLEELIVQLEAAGAQVAATVSDLGGSNRRLWVELGVSHDGPTCFRNPADNSRYSAVPVCIQA